MTNTPTVNDLDLDALRKDARERRDDLLGQRQGLAIDALMDHEVRHALLDVEAALVAVEAELERLDLAETESERRGIEARGAAVRAAREGAIARAAKARAEKMRAAKKVDAAGAAWAREVAAFALLDRAEHDALVEAGERPYGMGGNPSPPIAGALHHALRHAGARDVLLTSFSGAQIQPLAAQL